MPNLGDVDPSIVYCMLKGEPGLRKSTAALSFPRPQYWFSWDQKMNSLLLPMQAWKIPIKEIQYDDYKDWNAARAKLTQFQVNCPFKTLIFDSLTSCADMTLRQTVQMKYGITRSSGVAAGKTIAGIAVNEIEDYNAESAALQELIALTKDIKSYHKINIVLIAHVVSAEYRNTTNNQTYISRTIVTAGKKVAPKIPAYCDEVYHFNIKKSIDTSMGGQYEILTTHTGDDFARTALPLPSSILIGDDPLYDKYMRPAIEKMKKFQEESKQQTTTNPTIVKP